MCIGVLLQELKKQVVESGEDLVELEASVSRLREEVAAQRVAEEEAAEERRRRLEAARVAGLVPPADSEKAGPLVQPSEGLGCVNCSKRPYCCECTIFFGHLMRG